MTPAQAAIILGCTPEHVRKLCRDKVLKSTPKVVNVSGKGYETTIYQITEAEVRRYAANRPKPGPKKRKGA